MLSAALISDIFIPYIQDTSTLLCLALPANGDLDRDGLPLISRLTVLSAIHCSTGLTLDTSEVFCIYQTWTSVFAMRVMFCLLKPWWGCWWGRRRRVFNVGLCSQVELTEWWEGRVRQAHSRPYPLSSFMATVLNGVCTSITKSSHSEPSGWLKGKRGVGESGMNVCCASKEQSFLLIFQHLSFTGQKPGPQSDLWNLFTIMVSKHSWVVVFPWFLGGKEKKTLVSTRVKIH